MSDDKPEKTVVEKWTGLTLTKAPPTPTGSETAAHADNCRFLNPDAITGQPYACNCGAWEAMRNKPEPTLLKQLERWEEFCKDENQLHNADVLRRARRALAAGEDPAGWKAWHRELCEVLGLEVVERSVTLAKVAALKEASHE